jgi:hypothetical protein
MVSLSRPELDDLCKTFRNGCPIEVDPISWEEIPEDWKNVFRFRMEAALLWLEEKGKLKC